MILKIGKITTVSILLALLSLFLLALTACKEGDSEHSHTPGELVVENKVSATCSQAGSYDEVVRCTVCSAELSRDVKATEKLPHTEVIDKAIEPTCTDAGRTEGRHCSVCSEVLVACESVDKLEHSYSEELAFDSEGHYYECACGAKKDGEAHLSSGAPSAESREVCTSCGYVISEAVGIRFKSLTVNGDRVYGKVPCDTEYFSFIDEVETVGGAKFVVLLDITDNEQVYGKTIRLSVGDNTVYVIESLELGEGIGMTEEP